MDDDNALDEDEVDQDWEIRFGYSKLKVCASAPAMVFCRYIHVSCIGSFSFGCLAG